MAFVTAGKLQKSRGMLFKYNLHMLSLKSNMEKCILRCLITILLGFVPLLAGHMPSKHLCWPLHFAWMSTSNCSSPQTHDTKNTGKFGITWGPSKTRVSSEWVVTVLYLQNPGPLQEEMKESLNLPRTHKEISRSNTWVSRTLVHICFTFSLDWNTSSFCCAQRLACYL